MKVKKEYIILALVIVALALYLVFRKSDRTHYALPDIPKVAGKEISKLEIKPSGNTIVLEKKDNTWYIGPKAFPADSKKIEKMLNGIESLTVTALVSESKNYIRYDLNEDKKIAVKAWAGNTLRREFDIGKTASTYQHTFLKLAGDPNVYHARGQFRNHFDQAIGDLRNRIVLSFKKDEITEIETLEKEKKSEDIKSDEKKTVVRRKAVAEEKEPKKNTPKPEDTPKIDWQTADGKDANPAVVDRLLSYLMDLECDGYIEDKKKEDLKTPVYTVTLKGQNDYSLSIFPKNESEEKNSPAISSQNDYAFLLSDAKVDYIKNSVTDMLKAEEK